MPRKTESERFARIEQKLDDMDDKLDSIDKQVKITNGRVNTLEDWKIQHMAALKATKEERANHAREHKDERDWTNKKTLLVLAIIMAVFGALQLWVAFGKG